MNLISDIFSQGASGFLGHQGAMSMCYQLFDFDNIINNLSLILNSGGETLQ